MKNLFIISCLFVISISGYTQGVAINGNGNPADPTALFDVSSHTQGVLMTRLRTIERTAIQNPPDGLFTYDIDTHSFWFSKGGIWKEILNEGVPLLPTGPASGDLTGSYPSPTVAKIQNLDVVFGVPFDHQVLKWDALANNWKGRNDSLFLPYNVAYGSPTKLFGIQNNNTTSGSSAVFGRSGTTGSGITPSVTMGVWGDNSNGIGVIGTSSNGTGTYGLSFGNHGVYGYSTLANFAGVCGSHANPNGIGVLGDIQNSGKAIYGRSTGASGKAAYFENSNTSNTDTTVVMSTAGTGELCVINASNANNGQPALSVTHAGEGMGIKLRVNKTTNPANALDIHMQGTGYGIWCQSQIGSPGKFTITNVSNASTSLYAHTNGLGTALNVTVGNSNSMANALELTNQGNGAGINVASIKGKAGVFNISSASAANETINVSTNANFTNAIFKSNNTSSYESNMYVEQNGLGKGIEINSTHAGNGNAGLSVNAIGELGVYSNAYGLDPTGVWGKASSNVDAGIGVLGETIGTAVGGVGVSGIATSVDGQGIGVKGTSYSTVSTLGSVTGINYSTGVGLYGEVAAAAGYGVVGICGQTNLDAHAAKFENKYNNSNSENVSILTNGKGINLYMNNTNANNTQPQLRMIHSGTGNFMQFEASPGDIKTSLAKSGNFKTSGTVTVKNDKGIVRSSTTSQLRVEIVQAVWDASGSYETLSPLESRNVPVTFSAAFTSAPAVYIANLLSGANADEMLCSVINVTTTGCTLHFINPHSQDISVFDSSWNLVAMGQE